MICTGTSFFPSFYRGKFNLHLMHLGGRLKFARSGMVTGKKCCLCHLCQYTSLSIEKERYVQLKTKPAAAATDVPEKAHIHIDIDIDIDIRCKKRSEIPRKGVLFSSLLPVWMDNYLRESSRRTD